MKQRTLAFSGLILIVLFILQVTASSVLVPNGSFEEGVLCTVPDQWIMKTWDRDGSDPVPGATYLHDVCENDTHHFAGSRSCWLYSKVIDTDGTVASRGCHTWVESEEWISQPTATHVRFFIRDIQHSHSLSWGWNCGIYIGFNDTDTDRHYDYCIYNNGETLNFNNYNDTKVGSDGATWFEYIYPIPADINQSQMRFRILCFAGDWTFYSTSYYAEMSFYVDNVELIYAPTAPLSVSISPASASINVGDSVSFTSTVSGGTVPYSYKWYLDGNPVLGATSSNWTFTPTTSGVYYVYLKVTDAAANATQSETARIAVASPAVGGFSTSIEGHTSAIPLSLYIGLIAVTAVGLIVIRRKTTRVRARAR